MTTPEQDIARHYTHGSLEQSILAGLTAVSQTLGTETIDQLAAVDEFHIGGRETTRKSPASSLCRPG